ncbi:DNA cytosine methyltransferase [Micromonospora sp. NPDC047465]|uniref:DNA cytosine methyltransferase n=1 Tax=Micromonospora sp. NPDC047465 TaxID=3154813 RepID=UPI0033F0BF76
MLKLGSLCTGYGGLDLAAEHVLGPLEHTWHAEIDPHAAKVLAHHWPTTPNLGDLTTVDWTTAPAIDVLTAGYPCQPLSLAGRRAGLTDERWIWDDVHRAIRALRPRLVLLENVAGHLSLGFGRVLGDLAAAGFDAEWGCFRASDVGTPHRRERVFIAAWPADCPPDAGTLAGRVGVGAAAADGVTLLPTPRASDTGTPGRRASEGFRPPLSEVLLNLLPTPTRADGERRSHTYARGNPTLIGALLPTPTGRDGMSGPGHAASAEGSPDLRTTVTLLPTPMAADGGSDRASSAGFGLRDTSRQIPDQWGQYAPAIARWEAVTGRQAPSPTEPGKNGQPRLAPPFVEWLMGLPAGWVTDHLGRGPSLKCLGNGVVPQQAAHAYAELLGAAA